MPAPDLIVVNGNIVTMDPLAPRVEALAVRGGRVSAHGTTAAIRRHAASGSLGIDAGGRLVLPGFQDTHIHLQDSGQAFAQNANLEAPRTIDELVAALKA